MIRRQVGDEFWLIKQNDHAIISGQLAQAVGNVRFDAPALRAVRAIELHDCGWPTHDENPTLNTRRQPLDVFETPRRIGLSVWTESSNRAAAEDAYAGLLVSLHSLSLSILATTMTPFAHERFDPNDPRGRFEVNQFQHRQIELQEELRGRLGPARRPAAAARIGRGIDRSGRASASVRLPAPAGDGQAEPGDLLHEASRGDNRAGDPVAGGKCRWQSGSAGPATT
jgi:hypothetical protein